LAVGRLVFYGWMDREIVRQRVGWKNKQMDGWMDISFQGFMDIRMIE
jgi:hypothetical protein